MKFRATIELGGRTATGLEVPAEVVESLGSTKRPAVRVTIIGFTYRSKVATMGGRSTPIVDRRAIGFRTFEPSRRGASASG